MPNQIKFIEQEDEFGSQINIAANELFLQIRHLDVDSLPIDSFCRDYFKQCHAGRLIFSLQCSARIIYDSVAISNQRTEEIIFLDYGAGLGTLFMLAAKLPFNQVIYNDHLQEWCDSAKVICEVLNIGIRHFIKGDIKDLAETCRSVNVIPDIVASRNVIEHIYNLHSFFAEIKSFAPACVVYSSTTANFQNPLMRLKHILYHHKVEKKWHKQQRQKIILGLYPHIDQYTLRKAVEATRGKAMEDFHIAIQKFMQEKKVDHPAELRSNTCDATTGVWAEHLLSSKDYKTLITNSGLEYETKPGFWDTHYRNVFLNFFGVIINTVINLLGRTGVLLAPFIAIIAKPRKI